MKISTKLSLAMMVLGTLGFAGTFHLVNAVPPLTPTLLPENRNSQPSHKVGDGDGETNDDAKEQQESTKLQPLAKISPQQAQQVAEAIQGGKASSVKLENDDGNLVYAVVFGQKEVKVDAGNGHILYTETGNDRKDKKSEASRPCSSIQVTESIGGDGDGEIKDDG